MYLNGIKIIKNEILSYLTPISLAYWIMCDGNKLNEGLQLNTYAFTKKEHDILMLSLNKNFNIECS